MSNGLWPFVAGALLAISGVLGVLLKKQTRLLAQQKEQTSSELNSALHKYEELQKEREQTLAMLTSMVEGVLVIDNKERVLVANEAFAKMFKWDEAARQRPFWESLRHPELTKLIRDSLSQETSAKAQLSIFTPEEKIIEAQASPMRGMNHSVRGIVCVLHDITALKKLERLKSDFVANVSHELRTPLTSIKGFVETLQNGALNEPERAQQFLNIIEEHTLKLDAMIQDLLDLARLEDKPNEIVRKSLHLRDLFDRCIKPLEWRLEKSKQRIEVEIEGEEDSLLGDALKLEQLFSNLIENAIKFTPDEGGICIQASRASDKAVVSVTDSGVGIASEHLPRIFERFYRVDASRSRESGGVGLGLAIAKHIAQAHQGEIFVESEPGKGTKFTVLLPIA